MFKKIAKQDPPKKEVYYSAYDGMSKIYYSLAGVVESMNYIPKLKDTLELTRLCRDLEEVKNGIRNELSYDKSNLYDNVEFTHKEFQSISWKMCCINLSATVMKLAELFYKMSCKFITHPERTREETLNQLKHLNAELVVFNMFAAINNDMSKLSSLTAQLSRLINLPEDYTPLKNDILIGDLELQSEVYVFLNKFTPLSEAEPMLSLTYLNIFLLKDYMNEFELENYLLNINMKLLTLEPRAYVYDIISRGKKQEEK